MAMRRIAVIAAGVAVIVIAAGIGAFLLLNKPAETGRVTIFVKDAPDEWDHVNVTFSEVRIHEANATNGTGWHTLKIMNGTVDLTELVNVSELLAAGNVSAGKYTQVRIVVLNATGVMANGTMVDFKVPSGELKTTHPFTVVGGETVSLTLDIDLSHSIVHTSQGWIFKPVLGAIVQG